MRVSLFSSSLFALFFVAGCAPQEHPADFYTKPENAAEFAKALDVCSKSGFSLKDKCAAVWQAKMTMDIAADRVRYEQAIKEAGGVTTVPHTQPQAPVADPNSSRIIPRAAAATADPSNPTVNN